MGQKCFVKIFVVVYLGMRTAVSDFHGTMTAPVAKGFSTSSVATYKRELPPNVINVEDRTSESTAQSVLGDQWILNISSREVRSAPREPGIIYASLVLENG